MKNGKMTERTAGIALIIDPKSGERVYATMVTDQVGDPLEIAPFTLKIISPTKGFKKK